MASAQYEQYSQYQQPQQYQQYQQPAHYQQQYQQPQPQTPEPPLHGSQELRQQAQAQARPRPKSRIMSWGSGRKSGEEEHRPKVDLTESPRDKARSRMSMSTHADPTRAMNELQPGEVQWTKATTESLRSIQHKDTYGNVITDPDRSNPTRPRMERPLDTIRSFEAAVDGRPSGRSSSRPETAEPGAGHGNRRSSYYQGHGAAMQNRFQDDGYNGGGGYRGHPAVNGFGYSRGMNRAETAMDSYRSSHSPAPLREQRRMPPRGSSDHMLYRDNADGGNYYGNGHHHQHSYETATNGSGSGRSHGTEPWSNSTDPSSENSSLDRLQQAPPPPPKADAGEQYGFSGFGGAPDLQQTPIMEEGYDYSRGYGHEYDQQYEQQYQQQSHYQHRQQPQQHDRQYRQQHEAPPPPPPHAAKPNVPRAPSKLQSARRQSSQQGRHSAQQSRSYDEYGAPVNGGAGDAGEKRKSWLKRRFSKN